MVCCAGLLLLTACRSYVDADVELLGEQAYEPRPASSFVAAYENENEITRKWAKIGIVYGRGKPEYIEEVVAAMKVKARKIGGDAIVVRKDFSETTGGSVSSYREVPGGYDKTRRKLLYRQAIVIRFMDDAEAARQQR